LPERPRVKDIHNFIIDFNLYSTLNQLDNAQEKSLILLTLFNHPWLVTELELKTDGAADVHDYIEYVCRHFDYYYAYDCHRSLNAILNIYQRDTENISEYLERIDNVIQHAYESSIDGVSITQEQFVAIACMGMHPYVLRSVCIPGLPECNPKSRGDLLLRAQRRGPPPYPNVEYDDDTDGEKEEQKEEKNTAITGNNDNSEENHVGKQISPCDFDDSAEQVVVDLGPPSATVMLKLPSQEDNETIEQYVRRMDRSVQRLALTDEEFYASICQGVLECAEAHHLDAETIQDMLSRPVSNCPNISKNASRASQINVNVKRIESVISLSSSSSSASFPLCTNDNACQNVPVDNDQTSKSHSEEVITLSRLPKLPDPSVEPLSSPNPETMPDQRMQRAPEVPESDKAPSRSKVKPVKQICNDQQMVRRLSVHPRITGCQQLSPATGVLSMLLTQMFVLTFFRVTFDPGITA
jgi:hypothetical protein